jgi:hypothetical protein
MPAHLHIDILKREIVNLYIEFVILPLKNLFATGLYNKFINHEL